MSDDNSFPVEKLKNSIDGYISRLISIEMNIAFLREDAKLIREGLKSSVNCLLRRIPKDQIETTATDLYWTDPTSAVPIREAYSLLKRGRFPSSDFTVFCPSCNDEHSIKLTSWTAYNAINKRHPICPKCKNKKDEMYQQKSLEYEKKVEHLKTMPYSEYLKTEHWQNKRKEVLQFSGYRCQLCYKAAPLQVHHRTYERRGHEAFQDLIALCADCHSKHHNIPSPKG